MYALEDKRTIRAMCKYVVRELDKNKLYATEDNVLNVCHEYISTNRIRVVYSPNLNSPTEEFISNSFACISDAEIERIGSNYFNCLKHFDEEYAIKKLINIGVYDND